MGNFLIDELGCDVLDEQGNPVPAPFGGLGRWGNTGTPHTEWKCTDVFYRDERPGRLPLNARGAMICQMCETQAILHVHRMTHPTFPETLLVGKECAGHMSGDPERMKELREESDAIRAAVARYRGEWLVRERGGFKLATRGFRLVVQQRGVGLWSGWFVHTPSGAQWRTRLLPLDEVQREAVKYMVKARRKIGREQRATRKQRELVEALADVGQLR